MASFNLKKIPGKGSGSRVAAIMRHNDTELRKTTNHSNADIDITQSGRNVELYDYRESYRRHKDRIAYLDEHEPVKGKINTRSDRCECLMWECPAPEGLDPDAPEDRQVFFDACKDWLTAKYGADNVTGIWLHADEIHDYRDNRDGDAKTSRMHVHCTIVPEKDGRLCCKEVFAKKTLSRDQKDFDALIRQRCRDELGKDVVFLTGESFNRELSVEELKAHAAEGQVKALRAEQKELNDKIRQLEENTQNLQADYDDLQDEYDEIADEYYKLDSQARQTELTVLKFRQRHGITDEVMDALCEFERTVDDDIRTVQEYHAMATAIVSGACKLRDVGNNIVFMDADSNIVGEVGKADMIQMLGLKVTEARLSTFFRGVDILRDNSYTYNNNQSR